MKRLFVAAMFSLVFAGTASATSYNIDPRHTQVLFTYDHFGYAKMTGRLNEVSGTFEFDMDAPANSSINVELPMSTLSTGIPKLDAHMSGPDMFDVEKFPTASFKSSKVLVLDKEHLTVAGELTIHGVTQPVVLDVTINKAGIDPKRKVASAGFTASATIKRSEFGVSFMLPGVSDEVKLTINMEAREPQKEDPEAQKPG
jgi:polyisoprenoid-binding protein YceI